MITISMSKRYVISESTIYSRAIIIFISCCKKRRNSNLLHPHKHEVTAANIVDGKIMKLGQSNVEFDDNLIANYFPLIGRVYYPNVRDRLGTKYVSSYLPFCRCRS
jgi:hypothetical protein